MNGMERRLVAELTHALELAYLRGFRAGVGSSGAEGLLESHDPAGMYWRGYKAGSAAMGAARVEAPKLAAASIEEAEGLVGK